MTESFLSRPPSVLRRWIATAFASALLHAPPAHSLDTTQIEHLRVAFTLNFARYTGWPDGGPPDTFRLCVSAGDALYAAFSSVEGTSLRGRSIRLRRVRQAGDMLNCELVYASATTDYANWLQPILDHPTLTVGEDTAFLSNGGTIRLYVGDDRMQFDVNLPQAERSRLTLSPQLLRLSHAVLGSKGP